MLNNEHVAIIKTFDTNDNVFPICLATKAKSSSFFHSDDVSFREEFLQELFIVLPVRYESAREDGHWDIWRVMTVFSTHGVTV